MLLSSGSLAAAIALVAFPSIISAVHDPEQMLISWPPALSFPRWKDGEPVDARAADSRAVQKDKIFGCSDYPIPPNVKRTPFPINGARVQINRTGTPWINSYPQVRGSIEGDWMMNVDYGQFQGLSGIPDFAYHRVHNDFFWRMDEFQPGLSCSEPFADNLTEVQTGYREKVYPIDASKLEGLELTLGLNVFHFYPEGVSNESAAQTITQLCAYIRLTAGPVDTPCKPGSDSDSTDTLPTAGIPTATGAPGSFPSEGSSPDSGSGSSGSGTSKSVIIAVAATAGVAVPLIIIITLLCMRRRKKKAAKPPLAVSVIPEKKKQTQKEPMVEEKKPKKPVAADDKKSARPTSKLEIDPTSKKKDANDGQSSIHTDAGSRSSVYTEPLPLYEPGEKGGA